MSELGWAFDSAQAHYDAALPLWADADEVCECCGVVLTDANAATRTDPTTGYADWTGSCADCAADPLSDDELDDLDRSPVGDRFC